MNKNRPSNILIYVVVSLVGLFGFFVLGLFLESRNNKLFDQGAWPATSEISQGRAINER